MRCRACIKSIVKVSNTQKRGLPVGSRYAAASGCAAHLILFRCSGRYLRPICADGCAGWHQSTYGRSTISAASSFAPVDAVWKMKQERMTPAYTTDWGQIIDVWK
ncbi:DUF4113 domain-containing protein [Alcaligenes faecalis]|nr:DUF4113 domain-containing protein [Alcaligenes faecalis]